LEKFRQSSGAAEPQLDFAALALK